MAPSAVTDSHVTTRKRHSSGSVIPEVCQALQTASVGSRWTRSWKERMCSHSSIDRLGTSAGSDTGRTARARRFGGIGLEVVGGQQHYSTIQPPSNVTTCTQQPGKKAAFVAQGECTCQDTWEG
eukprot:6239056-Prymnesium_polylepis.2